MRTVISPSCLIAVVVFCVAATEVPSPLLRSDAPALEIATSVEPVGYSDFQLLKRPTPQTFKCSVIVRDEPGSKRVWTTKDLLLNPGESGEQSATLGPLQLSFKAKIGKNLDRAETSVTVTRDSKVITRQVSQVYLVRVGSNMQPRR